MKPDTNPSLTVEGRIARPRVLSFVAHNRVTLRFRQPFEGVLNPLGADLAGRAGWLRTLRGIVLAMLFFSVAVRGTLLWDGNATNGLSVFKILIIEGANGSSVTAVDDPIYGKVWRFYKALDDHRCREHGAAGFNPAIGQTC